MTQPFDVAFFQPLKMSMRKILEDWKSGPGRCVKQQFQKTSFPCYWKKCLKPAKLKLVGWLKKTWNNSSLSRKGSGKNPQNFQHPPSPIYQTVLLLSQVFKILTTENNKASTSGTISSKKHGPKTRRKPLQYHLMTSLLMTSACSTPMRTCKCLTLSSQKKMTN